jgi:hypothetical protein
VVLDLSRLAALALDPLPLTALLVILPSKRGVRKGAVAEHDRASRASGSSGSSWPPERAG